MGLRHRRSDPIVITDGSSSLCVHGPPGSIRWAELVCGRFSAAPTNSRRGGDTAPSYDSSVRRRTPRVHRNRRGTRTVVEGRASIVTSPGGTAAPGSWIHHVGVLNADRVLVRRRCTMIPPNFGSRALRRVPSTGACGLGDYPTPDLSRRESESRSTSEKSKQFGPDGASFPSKTSITRGPPGIVIAVSSDPILPHR